MIVKMFVACENCEGPTFFFCNVSCSQSEYEEGEHYEVAKNVAMTEGYQTPMVAFDENDKAGKAMLDKFQWDTAKTFSSYD